MLIVIVILTLLLALALLFTWRLALCRFRAPDFVIGKPGSVYMNRWWVIPRNPFFNIYLHEIRRDDDDRALHDHPWVNCSIVLKGGYWEVLPEYRPSLSWPVPPTRTVWRKPGSIVLRRPTSAHRLVVGNVHARGGACWSLFVTGPVVREWGFWCAKGWVPREEFLDPSNGGLIGRGCGEG